MNEPLTNLIRPSRPHFDTKKSSSSMLLPQCANSNVRIQIHVMTVTVSALQITPQPCRGSGKANASCRLASLRAVLHEAVHLSIQNVGRVFPIVPLLERPPHSCHVAFLFLIALAVALGFVAQDGRYQDREWNCHQSR